MTVAAEPATVPRLRLQVVDNHGHDCGHVHYSHHAAVNCRRVLIRKHPERSYRLRQVDD